MKNIPVYDKDIFRSINGFEWYFKASSMLDDQSQKEPLSLGVWVSMIKQADELAETLPAIKEHSIYQRLWWEIE